MPIVNRRYYLKKSLPTSREQSSILENITNKEVNTLPAASAQPPKPRGPLKDIVDGQQPMDGRKIVCIPIETEPSSQLINPPALPGLKTLGIIAPPVLMRLMLLPCL